MAVATILCIEFNHDVFDSIKYLAMLTWLKFLFFFQYILNNARQIAYTNRYITVNVNHYVIIITPKCVLSFAGL